MIIIISQQPLAIETATTLRTILTRRHCWRTEQLTARMRLTAPLPLMLEYVDIDVLMPGWRVDRPGLACTVHSVVPKMCWFVQAETPAGRTSTPACTAHWLSWVPPPKQSTDPVPSPASPTMNTQSLLASTNNTR